MKSDEPSNPEENSMKTSNPAIRRPRAAANPLCRAAALAAALLVVGGAPALSRQRSPHPLQQHYPSPSGIQLTTHPVPRPIPAEAWLRMDTSYPIDTELHRQMSLQRDRQQQQATRQQRFSQAYSRQVESVSRMAVQSQLALADPATRQAVSIVSHYRALREVDGEGAARQWLNGQKETIDRMIVRIETPSISMWGEASLGTLSLLTEDPQISSRPSDLGHLKRLRNALQRLGA
jgi:hypothetical protein